MERLRMFTKQRWLRFATVLFAVLAALWSSVALGSTNTAHAAGSPPDHSTNLDKIHAPYPGLNPHGVSRLTNQGLTTITNNNPIIFIHGIYTVSGAEDHITCTGSAGMWTNPLSYLSHNHSGLGSD